MLLELTTVNNNVELRSNRNSLTTNDRQYSYPRTPEGPLCAGSRTPEGPQCCGATHLQQKCPSHNIRNTYDS